MKKCIHLKGRSGIYMIFNTVNNKVYIGQTKCMYSRCSQYIYDFSERKLGHLNQYLTRAMEKEGIENFLFIPLEFVDNSSHLIEREHFWINEMDSLNRNNGYNLRLDHVDYGLITNSETSKKMSDNLKKQWSSGIRDQHSEKMTASWASDPDRKEKQSSLFTKMRTKYEYKVFLPSGEIIVNYSELKQLGLESILSVYHRKKTNDGFCNGVRVVRSPLGESK